MDYKNRRMGLHWIARLAARTRPSFSAWVKKTAHPTDSDKFIANILSGTDLGNY